MRKGTFLEVNVNLKTLKKLFAIHVVEFIAWEVNVIKLQL